jgi:hypothetical protein
MRATLEVEAQRSARTLLEVVLPAMIKKRGERRTEVQPDFAQVGDNKIIGSTRWTGADGIPQERHQVVTLRGGKIIDMQGCASRREAERFARRH